MNLEDIHDYVHVDDEDQLELDLGQAALEFLAEEDPFGLYEEDDVLVIDMTVHFEDGAQVSIQVVAPDKEHALAALVRASAGEYLAALAQSLEEEE
ncbi:hypothetical protein SEA_SYDNAT_55 [Mycobacterium phage SydNat]|uniref:Uncharacterized protein n=2 Tax=Benedictvirus TaxID=2946819 RepID=A0A5Q2WA67_9CAUD|nr:hypothetical protein KIP50_gp37 [Mycobacterium phage Zolita]YP_010060932.1 hypothetical protein KIP51_gp37 [Mycobacterium phage Bluefalcon]UVK64275.1 hypothetical protein SEA_SYDNAT_55 [Mycobacterium phage SydNat]UVK64361.1 hypothetical protein SEA_GHOULBOY_55 [Mycobacterium phage Ghoulboy]QDK03138.1 hypothetical protein SEA_ZOLITA_54 [Mycobacterium phage Zolita]QGH75396.1 hypothetical protein SEA_BLUEFALCON_51 [Mycobacterium phage Bluefalcon]